MRAFPGWRDSDSTDGDGTTLIDDVAYPSAGSSNNRPAVAYTLAEDLPANALMVFKTHGNVTNKSGPGVFLCPSNEVLGLTNRLDTAPATNDFDDALKVLGPKVADHGWGHNTLYIWRHTDDDKLWIASGRGDALQLELETYPLGGGSGSGDDAAAWAEQGNTDAIPGSKMVNAGAKVIANDAVALAAYAVGAALLNRDDAHFYEVKEDASHATHPLRITFAPDDIAAEGEQRLSYGYAVGAISDYANAAHGALTVVPDVTANVPAALTHLLAISLDDQSEGTILVGIAAASAFVPARIRWRVGGRNFESAVGFDGDVTGGTHRYFASTHFEASLGNPWHIPEGDTDDVVVDFDILDASGASIAPNTVQRRYLERLDLAGTQSGYAEAVTYGAHAAPEPQDRLLIDDATGDEYFARRIQSADLMVVEPVRAGNDYGLAPGNKAAFGTPAALSRLTWDANGLVDVEGTAANLGGWKKIAHRADPAASGGERTARLVEVPASTTPLGTRRKRALLCDWHSSLARIAAAANADGNPQVNVTGGHIEFTVDSTRKLHMRLDAANASVDNGQMIGLQRVTPEVSSNIHWRCGIQESASDDGTVPDTGLWGSFGGNLHPVWFEWSLRVVGTEDEQRAGSYIEAGHRVFPDETMWLVIYYDANESANFIGIPPVVDRHNPQGYNAIKLVYDPTDVTTGTVQRHRYTIAADSPTLPAAIYSLATAEMPHYIGLVITANTDTDLHAMKRSLEPVNFNAVELEGVPIPVAISERRMVLESGTQTSALVSSVLRTDWQSAAFGADQEPPLAAGTEYAVNMSNERGVRGRPYLSNTHPPSKHAASGFKLLDAADTAETTADAARAWWDIRSRGLPRTNAPPEAQGDPWRLRRWSGAEHRAVPGETDQDIQGYVDVDTFVAGGQVIANWSRTVMHQLTDEGRATVIGRVAASPVSNDARSLSIQAATGGALTPAHIRLINRTRGWEADFRNVSPHGLDRWIVSLPVAQYPLNDGDEIRLRLRAPSPVDSAGHTPIAWSHAVNNWENV